MLCGVALARCWTVFKVRAFDAVASGDVVVLGDLLTADSGLAHALTKYQ